MKIKILVLALFFFNLSCVYKKQTGFTIVKCDLLKRDFQILRKTLEEAHPGLYWYADKKVLDHYFDSTYALINHDMTSTDFFKLLLPVIANVRCIHTNLKAQKTEDFAAPFYQLLPFDFFCREGKLYISKYLNNTGHAGAEVISINNKATNKILETLLNSLPADGYNESFKYHLLSAGAFREGFAFYFGQSDTFRMEVINMGSLHPVLFSAKAKTPREISDTKTNIPYPPLTIRFENKLNTAILAVNTFDINTVKFSDTLAAIFKKIKECSIQNLIIDLRQNGGGNNDNVSALFSCIASSPFLHLKRAETNKPEFTHLQYFTNLRNFNNPGGIAEPNGKYLVNYKYAGTSLKNPVKNDSFKGNVVILTCGNTTSSASEFAAISYYTKRAKIVGEETGGCYYGATGGNYINLLLSASKLQVRIPTIRIYNAVEEDYAHHPKGRGTIPDYEIVPTINDVINGRDVQLEKAINLLSK